jgi:hypothetical protein
MADSIKMAVFKSVTKTTLTASMLAVSMVRLGMMAYPEPVHLEVNYTSQQGQPTSTEVQTALSKVVSSGTKRRIVLGGNSIDNLGSSN